MRRTTFAALVAISALSLPASAQVHKCKDASGKTIYTDAPCASTQKGELIERRRTHTEIYQERMEAAQAENRKQERRLAEQDQERQEQWRRQLATSQQPTQPRHKGYAERLAERNAGVSAGSITNSGGKWDQAAERERDRRKQAQRDREHRDAAHMPAPNTPQPTNITRCDSGFCHDNTGGVYHRVGPDFMTSPNGRSCHRNGDIWNCN